MRQPVACEDDSGHDSGRRAHCRRHKESEQAFKSAVHGLSLAIKLRLKCSRHVLFNVRALSQSLSHFGCKTQTSVSNSVQWKTMLAEALLKEQVSPLLVRCT